MVSQVSRQGWCALHPAETVFADGELAPQAGMIVTEVVKTTNDEHACVQGLLPMICIHAI
jgi:hypothetical protein